MGLFPTSLKGHLNNYTYRNMFGWIKKGGRTKQNESVVGDYIDFCALTITSVIA